MLWVAKVSSLELHLLQAGPGQAVWPLCVSIHLKKDEKGTYVWEV